MKKKEPNFKVQLAEKVRIVNEVQKRILAGQIEIGADLKEAIEYTFQAGGKKIRAALVMWSCEVVSGAVNPDAEIAAAAIEMVHSYSLIHDDLPAMDNDDFRRGRLSCHKAFDEATAILTGDGLLTMAFELLAEYISEPAVSVQLICELSRAAGPAGMIAGQMADLKAENTAGSVRLLEYIHVNKTAKMFQCAAGMGAIAGGANKEQLNCLRNYGLKLGLAFQVADDILDIQATSEQLGKTAGKDAKVGKLTYPAVVGIEESKRIKRQFTDEAMAELELFGEKANILKKLVMSLLERRK